MNAVQWESDDVGGQDEGYVGGRHCGHGRTDTEAHLPHRLLPFIGASRVLVERIVRHGGSLNRKTVRGRARRMSATDILAVGVVFPVQGSSGL